MFTYRVNFVELRACELRRIYLLRTRMSRVLPVAGSSPIHRRVVNFISPGRGRMGETDRGLLRWIVLREALVASLTETCSIGAQLCGTTSENTPSTHFGE
jgi:hypothetical protein